MDHADAFDLADRAAPSPDPAPPGDEAEGRKPLLRGYNDLLVAAVAVPAALVLARNAQAGVATATVAIYGVGLVTLFGLSALYHTLYWGPVARRWLQRLDHATIFLFITATYVPFCLATDLERGPLILAIVGTGAALGVAKCLFWERAPRWLEAALYVLLGLTLLPFAPEGWAALGPTTFTWTIVGGVFYIVGAVIYARRWPNPSPRVFGYHEVFHLFVYAGAASHYAAVWRVVVE